MLFPGIQINPTAVQVQKILAANKVFSMSGVSFRNSRLRGRRKAIIMIIVLLFFSMTIILSSNHLNLSVSLITLCDELKYKLESRNVFPNAHGKKYIYALLPNTSDFSISTINRFHRNAAP